MAQTDAAALVFDREQRKLHLVAEEEGAKEREREKERLALYYAGGGEEVEGAEGEGGKGQLTEAGQTQERRTVGEKKETVTHGNDIKAVTEVFKKRTDSEK